MYDSEIRYNEMIDVEAKLNGKETNFNEENITYKTQNFYILLIFLLITIALLIAVSIYCYLIKYRAKKNIYYHFTTQITN